MKGKLYLSAVLALWLSASPLANGQEPAHWEAPFDTAAVNDTQKTSDLSLNDVIDLVADKNPVLKSLEYRRQSARELIDQAGARPNPELEAEFEEVGWDAPGLKESEISVSLSQELELFGQPGARRAVAHSGLKLTALEARMAAYDLFLETKRRFYAMAHAQEHYRLTDISVALADSIVDNITIRIEKGAALSSELTLAQLELQKVELDRSEAEQALESARISLGCLWQGECSSLSLKSLPEPEPSPVLAILDRIGIRVDSTREAVLLGRQAGVLEAEKRLAEVESRPAITLSGGYKRAEADNSNSFLFGFSLPLPLWNSNQGTRRHLQAELLALEYEGTHARIEAGKDLRTGVLQLRQLYARHTALDDELLPMAEEAYRTLNEAYRAGRLPYTSLLEAERSLNELRFEHNDMLLSIQFQIIALEELTGVTLQPVTR